MGGLANEVTFTGDAYRGHGVVSRYHSASQMRSTKCLNSGSCAGFQPVLEDDKAQETQAGFRLFTTNRVSVRCSDQIKMIYLPLHLLCLQP